MPLAALIALLPDALKAASAISDIIQEMSQSGATETTAEQDDRLAAAGVRRRAADDAYDALPQA